MRRLLAPLTLALLVLAAAAHAQTTPGLVTGQVPTATQWNSYFGGKVDYNPAGIPVTSGGTGANNATAALTNLGGFPVAGGTLLGELTLNPSGSGGAGLNCGAGTAPSMPSANDLWCTSVGVFYRAGGATQQLANLLGANTWGATQTMSANLGVGGGVQVGSPTGGYEGVGSVNAVNYFVNGSAFGNIVTLNSATFAQVANNLSDLASASAARTNLSLGTAALDNTGMSGATLGLLNGNLTFSGNDTFTGVVKGGTGTAQTNVGQELAWSAPTPPSGWTGFTGLYDPHRFDLGGFPVADELGNNASPMAQVLVGTCLIPNTTIGNNSTGCSGVSGYAASGSANLVAVGVTGIGFITSTNGVSAFGMNPGVSDCNTGLFCNPNTGLGGAGTVLYSVEADMNISRQNFAAPVLAARSYYVSGSSEIQPTGLFNAIDVDGAGNTNQGLGTGAISGTTLTLSAVSAGTFYAGEIITAGNLAATQLTANTTITADHLSDVANSMTSCSGGTVQCTGTGGAGTYAVNNSQTVASEGIQGPKVKWKVGFNAVDGCCNTAFSVGVSQAATAARGSMPMTFASVDSGGTSHISEFVQDAPGDLICQSASGAACIIDSNGSCGIAALPTTDTAACPFLVSGLITGGSASDLIASSVNLNNGAASSVGTLTNAPAAGNPTKWIPINDNGTTRYIPAW